MTHAPSGRGVGTPTGDHADPGLVPALFAIGRRLRRAAGDTPVDQAGLVVLHRVSCSPEVRPTDVAADLGLDASTVSRHLRSLQQMGLVERGDDPDDRRAQRVSLSARGREVLDAAMAQRRAVVAAAVAGWSERDRRTLERLLVRLADDLDAVSPEEVHP
ncbi:MAG TPA: MarR family winged helix-turn-helix transcriptional regulator [Jiangellales bacterium]|nr:MarR family winged helix-turn-helix transcriptional regulator [Jiangellales bacterium]